MEEEFERDLQRLHGDPTSPMEDGGSTPCHGVREGKDIVQGMRGGRFSVFLTREDANPTCSLFPMPLPLESNISSFSLSP